MIPNTTPIHALNTLPATTGKAWWQYPIGHGYITSYQGPGTDTPHYADDVETPFHTPLTALLDGTVKVANYQAWGGQVFIQPDDKSLPQYYYYHPDEIDVTVGQHVSAGQFIGLSGGENPGFPGAEHPASPRFSSGPHTHVGWFQKYVSTPIGTEPFGPDIAPLLATGGSAPNLGITGAPPGTPLGTVGPGNCNGIQLPSWLGGGCVGVTTGQVVGSVDILYRIGFGLLGLILLLFAIRHFTGTTQTVVAPEAPAPQSEAPPKTPPPPKAG